MTTPKVLVSDKLSPQAIEIFEAAGVKADVKTGLSEDELCAIIGEYDGLAIRSATKVNAKVLAAAGRLKVVGRAGIGVDNVDVPASTARGVVVMNTPFGNSTTTAEHAIALMMALARQIPAANTSTHAGKWEKSKFMGMELAGKTLGLIGCGNIGSIVADRAQGLKMRVVAYDPFLTAERARDLNIEKLELDALLARADVITLHTPLTDSTRHILDAKSLAKMKKGACVINCARGGLVDEVALKDALVSGHLSGAALDVFEEEPAKNNPLFGLENVVCTPHLGASTSEAQEKVAVQVAEQMAAYLTTGAVSNAINIPSVSSEEAAKLRPYFSLSEQLGGFAGQLTDSAIARITVEYEGQVAHVNTKPLTSIILKSILAVVSDSVNMVNAAMVAKERNIDVQEIRNERDVDYKTLIRVTVQNNKGNVVVSGTLFGGTKPRIVDVNGVTLEASLAERMLYVQNEDKPGLIGGLGKVLGDAGVNIANFHLGRHPERAAALALLEVDQEISDALLQKVSALPSVLHACLLKFSA
jgi:D-3-phosphoglycerate dehydrogenase